MFRIVDSPRGHLLECHGAPPFENSQCSVQSTGNDRRVEPFAVQVSTTFEIPVDGGALGCPTLPYDRNDFVFRFWIDQDQCFAT